MQTDTVETIKSPLFSAESQQCRDVRPSRDLGLSSGDGGGLLLLEADEEDHQDLRDEDGQPGQRDHPHRRPGLRLRLLRIRLASSRTSDPQFFSSQILSAASMRRYEEQIRVLQDDLESEMTLRRRVEHEKQGLQMQVSFSSF